jgi:hypothetical protein
MEWFNSHKNPPEVGQKIYYFGPHIGIGIGHYSYQEDRGFFPYHYDENGLKVNEEKKIDLCPHIFTNEKFGVVDACDAPFWLPYDEERAKSWCPIIPEEYTKGLYD